VEEERHIAGVRVFVEMIDARGIERRRPPLDAVYRVAEAEQIFGEIGAVLTGDPGKERNAPFGILDSHVHSNKAPRLPNSSSTPTNKTHCAGPGRDSSLHGLKAGRPKPLS